MKKAQLGDFLVVLQQINAKDYPIAKFNYAIAKNIAIVETEVKILAGAYKKQPLLKEFEEKRMAIVKQWCDKNEDGSEKIIIDNGRPRYDFKKNDKEFKEAVSVLRAEYKEMLDAQTATDVVFDAMLEEEAEITLYKVKIENVPDSITGAEMTAIMPIIEA